MWNYNLLLLSAVLSKCFIDLSLGSSCLHLNGLMSVGRVQKYFNVCLFFVSPTVQQKGSFSSYVIEVWDISEFCNAYVLRVPKSIPVGLSVFLLPAEMFYRERKQHQHRAVIRVQGPGLPCPLLGQSPRCARFLHCEPCGCGSAPGVTYKNAEQSGRRITELSLNVALARAQGCQKQGGCST